MSGGCSRATPVPTGAISKRSKALTTRPAARLGRNIRQAYARARFEKDGEVETFHPVARARREGSRPLNRSALDRDVVRKCRKRPRPCEKSKSWVADPAASRLEHGGGLATAAPISRGVGRVGRVRDCCDRLTARFGLIVALEAGEIGVQPAAAAIIAGSPARLIARRML